MRLGEFELVPLDAGTFRLDGGAMFGTVPKVLWERRAPADTRNRIALALRPLLVRSSSNIILIDAGIGAKMSAKDTEIYAIDHVDALDRSLAALGLAPHDIDVVIATHLHFDHAGGFTVMRDGALAPHFPNARHLVRRGEWEDATHPHERNRASYLPENFLPLDAAGLVDLVDDDGEVLPGISVWRTGGHAMHHQIARITAAGRTAVFAADLIPTVAHIDDAWIMGYDLYPMDTLAYKRRFIAEAIAGEYVIVFEHDPAIAAGIIKIGVDGRRRVEAVPV